MMFRNQSADIPRAEATYSRRNEHGPKQVETAGQNLELVASEEQFLIPADEDVNSQEH